MPITVYTKGHFFCAHRIVDHPECGKMHNHEFTYEVWISSDTLSQAESKPYEEIIDVRDIDAYFKRFRLLGSTIESVTLAAVEYFIKNLEPQLSDFTVKVRLWQSKTYSAEYQKRSIVENKV